MEKMTLDLPTMYGDHHVTEVHALLSSLSGVGQVYASAAWQRVEFEYDAAQTDAESITTALRERGYSTDATLAPPTTSRTVSLTEFAVAPGEIETFAERVPAPPAVLIPCPGFAVRTPGDVHPADR